MVPLCLPDTILGNVPDNGSRHKGSSGRGFKKFSDKQKRNQMTNRRKFIQQVAAAGVAGSLPGFLYSQGSNRSGCQVNENIQNLNKFRERRIASDISNLNIIYP
jgi:hypothetical protein